MFAIIDIETTGISAKKERITEVAILLHDGNKITGEFSSLVNPERRVPYRITQLTGITTAMVNDAPRFCEIAKQIVELTEDRVIIGHNVAFDYNFLREEFKRLYYDFKRDTLCTVKLSRKLIPHQPSYSLGKLCQSLKIENHARHRAMGDAMATGKLFEMLKGIDPEAIKTSNHQLTKVLPPETVKKLPQRAGVYYFYNDRKEVIYVGKSNNIHQRVLTHLSNNSTKKAIEMRNNIADVSWEETGNELTALLLESHEIKKLKPLYNRAQRRSLYNWGIYKYKDDDGYIRLKFDRTKEEALPLSTFNSCEAAKEHLYMLCEKYELCQKLCGLYQTKNACFHYHIGKCHGACIAEESPEDYNKRLSTALEAYEYKHNSFFIIESGRSAGESSVVCVENGRYRGFGFIDDSIAIDDVLQLKDHIRPLQDNKDVQQIIRSWLRHHADAEIITY